jgi:Lipocalin-like domain
VRLCLPRRPLAPSPRRAKACGMTNDQTRQHILGTWKLIAAVREEIPSGIKTEFLGSTPIGYINYGADGRMLVLTVASGRRKPAGSKATSAEVEALFRSMTSYGGTYTIDISEDCSYFHRTYRNLPVLSSLDLVPGYHTGVSGSPSPQEGQRKTHKRARLSCHSCRGSISWAC